ncbi:alpha/beta fold hydrolase [Micropruina sp.]|uniref:alpha/beta fold hydrolase n=1 Tax=Micropruina sp. TaxID=2737536 RepID=UPI0039E2F0E1
MIDITRLPAGPLAALRAGRSERRPVVLIHGIFDSAACWIRVMEELTEDDRQVIAVDLPGHGTSPLIDRDFGLTRLASAVVETLGRLGVRTFDLIGHSLGGLVAHQIAQSRPELVHSLTLEDPAWGVSDDQPDAPPGFLCDRAAQLEAWPARKILSEGRAQHPAWDERDLCGWLEAKIDVDTTILRMNQDWVADTGPAAWDRYSGPVLLLTGNPDADAIVTIAMVHQARRALADRLTHSHHPSAGHNIRKDTPAAFMAAVRAFLAPT